MLFINIILNINELTNSSKSSLKIKSAKAKLIKNVIDTINNTVNILALLKWNAETEQDKEEYYA